MSTPTDVRAVPRSRLRSNQLWLLAALVGVATLAWIAFMIHDTGQRRKAARLTAQTMAEHMSLLAGVRLEVHTVQTFASVTSPYEAANLAKGRAGERGATALAVLVENQRALDRCRCRVGLPASEYFRLDVVSGALDRIAVTPGDTGQRPLSDLLIELARAQANTPRDTVRSPLHIAVGRALNPNAVVTTVQYNDGGQPVAVFGLVVEARSIGGMLFSNELPLPVPARHTIGLSSLDSLSLHVVASDSTLLYGALADDREYRATAHPSGALDGLNVTVGLAPEQIPLSVVLSHDQLWPLGVLLLATIVVVIVAARSSRRELLLARARSDFIAGVSHDLRMPLAQILLASETLILRRPNDTERLSLSSSIVREARRLIALVENVLLWSRSGSFELRPQLTKVAVNELLEDTVESMQLAVDEAGQTLSVQPSPSLAVRGDRHLLRQALVNLVDNAIKYGKEGQCIRLSAVENASGRVRLIVEDEGLGVPRSERVTVFEPYERLDRDQVSERTGTGLGLAVVRQIATACEGSVWLEDANGTGGGGGGGGGTRAILELSSSAHAPRKSETNGA